MLLNDTHKSFLVEIVFTLLNNLFNVTSLERNHAFNIENDGICFFLYGKLISNSCRVKDSKRSSRIDFLFDCLG